MTPPADGGDPLTTTALGADYPGPLPLRSVRSAPVNVFRDLVWKAPPLLQPLVQRLDEPFVPLLSARLCRHAMASGSRGGVTVRKKRTNSAKVSIVTLFVRSSRWTCRVSRSRHRTKAASLRSAPSGDMG
jgi:hypothetical protein